MTCFNCLWHACHQVWSKRGRYGGSGGKGKSSSQYPLPVHSSKQWRLLSSAPCHSVMLFRILQATSLKGCYWQEASCCKGCHQNLWNKWFSSKIRSWTGQEDAADEICCAEDKTELQGSKLQLDATHRDWHGHCSSSWRNIRQEYSCRSHQVFGQSKTQVLTEWHQEENNAVNCKTKPLFISLWKSNRHAKVLEDHD